MVLDKEIFNGVRDLLHVIEQIDKQTYAGKLLWYLFQINLVNHKPISGHVFAADSVMVHFNLAGMSLGDYREDIMRSGPVTIVYQQLGLDRSKGSDVVTNLVKSGIINRKQSGRHRYLSLPWPLIVQMHHAFTTGQIVPFDHINIID